MVKILILSILLASSGCAAKSYERGYAPIYGCRGDNAIWRLGWRENVRTDKWTIIAEHTWEEWTIGQRAGSLPSSRIVAIRYSRNIVSANVEGLSSSLLFPTQRCMYLSQSKKTIFYARHVERWK